MHLFVVFLLLQPKPEKMSAMASAAGTGAADASVVAATDQPSIEVGKRSPRQMLPPWKCLRAFLFPTLHKRYVGKGCSVAK